MRSLEQVLEEIGLLFVNWLGLTKVVLYSEKFEQVVMEFSAKKGW